MPQSKDYLFLPILIGGALLSEVLFFFEMRAAGITVLALTCVLIFFADRNRIPPSIRAGLSFGISALISGTILCIYENVVLGVPLLLIGVPLTIWSINKTNQLAPCNPEQVVEKDATEVCQASEVVEIPAVQEVPEVAAIDEVVIASHQDEVIELEFPSILKPSFSYSDISLPLDYPTPPTRWESQMAAVLLTHGKLKAFTHEFGFGHNGGDQVPLLSNRELAEAIIEQVPHIRIPVYKRVTPPLTDHPERELKDWERELEDWHMRPMPPNEPHLPARVTAFTSHPWGRVGIFLVVFDEPEMPVRWGLWYLHQPSAKTGTAMPFFRLGDFDDAELLAWLVLKPFLDAQSIVLEDMNPPEQSSYLGPWNRLGGTLRYHEMPEWFSEALNSE